jgi:hypothetical protein
MRVSAPSKEVVQASQAKSAYPPLQISAGYQEARGILRRQLHPQICAKFGKTKRTEIIVEIA